MAGNHMKRFWQFAYGLALLYFIIVTFMGWTWNFDNRHSLATSDAVLGFMYVAALINVIWAICWPLAISVTIGSLFLSAERNLIFSDGSIQIEAFYSLAFFGVIVMVICYSRNRFVW